MIKWKSISFEGDNCTIELIDGRKFTGVKSGVRYRRYYNFRANPVRMSHYDVCRILFDPDVSRNCYLLGDILEMTINSGYCPESEDCELFIKRYFERIASIDSEL